MSKEKVIKFGEGGNGSNRDEKQADLHQFFWVFKKKLKNDVLQAEFSTEVVF